MVRVHDDELVVADLPGLIEGASEGIGIGTRFLGHVERCPVILHLVDGTLDDVAGAYSTIRQELAAYGHGLADKPEIVGLNKIDALDAETIDGEMRQLRRAAGRSTAVMPMSGVSGAGVPEVLAALFAALAENRARDGEGAELAALAHTS